MADNELNLFDFGSNENGDYVNLVEEEKKLKDISSQELMNWVENHDDPLIRIAFDLFIIVPPFLFHHISNFILYYIFLQ